MKNWQKNLFTVLGVIVAMYAMVFIRVKMESDREFRDAEQYYRWWQDPAAKRDAMLKMLAERPKPKDVVFSQSERFGKIQQLTDMQRAKKPMQMQQALKRELAEYYFVNLEELKADLAQLLQNKTVDQTQHDSFARDLGDLFELSTPIEKFKREMTYYYFKHPEALKPDLDKLKVDQLIHRTEYAWLARELSEIKEVFESDIKTAFYGYATVVDIWLDPPGWPPSILRNSALAKLALEKIGTREEREQARLTGKASAPITQEFENWVREAAPPPITNPTGKDQKRKPTR